MRAAEKLKQWCPTCARVTATWVDVSQYMRCSGCDPEHPEMPGVGLHDYDPDDNWDSEE